MDAPASLAIRQMGDATGQATSRAPTIPSVWWYLQKKTSVPESGNVTLTSAFSPASTSWSIP